MEQVAILEERVASYFSVDNALAFGSGRGALLAYLLVLREELGIDTLALSSYTCPDIAAAAARAGYKLHILDTHPMTLQPIYDSLSLVNEQVAVLLSNLYGLVDELPENSTCYAALVDDACQSSLSMTDGARVGSRGDLGLVSFGRGKAICGIGGGALLFPREGKIKYKKFREQRQMQWGGSPGGSVLSAWLKATGGWLLERPSLYWLPASIPWLKLGESYFAQDFSVGPPSLVEIAAAAASLEDAESCRMEYLRKKKLWNEALDGLGLIEPVLERGQLDDGGSILTRYPIIFPDRKWREKSASDLHQAGLGVSRSYNRALNEYEGVSPFIASGPSGESRSLAKLLLTLPMHRYVNEQHIERSVEVLSKARN